MTETAPKYRKNWDPTRLSGRVFNALEKRLIRRAFARLPKGAVIADVPCGTGRLAEVLLEAGYRVVGIDISQSMLTVARRRLERFGDAFQTRQEDARSLEPEGGERYDAVLCARVLMHFPLAEQIAILRSVVRTTRGPVVFTQGLDTRYHRLRRRLKRLLRHPAPAAFPLAAADLDQLSRAAGLRRVACYRVLPVVSEAVVVVARPGTA
jgi:2-polyprenyl-3-methyl-5-hydroxy-6-metoxy-1,4-benzoquinol methylase